MTEKGIQIAVARADLILCWMARVLAVVMLAAILLTTLVLAWRFSNRIRYGRPTHYIDYDAPGVDITSEGPEAFTANWFIWECEKKGENGPTEHGPKGRQYDHK